MSVWISRSRARISAVSSRQRATARERCASGCSAAARQARLDPVQPHVAVEHPGRQREVELEVVQVPAQALLQAFALVDEVVAVVGQQAHVALRARRGAPRADRARAAPPAPRTRRRSGRTCRRCAPRSAPGHHLGRHAHDALAAGQQVALEAARDVAAVLDRRRGARLRGRAPRRAARRSRRRRCSPSPPDASSAHRVERPRPCGSSCAGRCRLRSCPSPSVGATASDGDRRRTHLSGASWPGSYQVTSATPRIRRRGHNT